MSRRIRGRGSRRFWMRSEDELPLSLIAVMNRSKSRGRKRKTPQKRTPRAARETPVRTPPAAPRPEVIELDDTPESADIVYQVNSKIGAFMQSGSFISSDEDEADMIKAKTNKKPSSNLFFISDDSDDDNKVLSTDFDTSKPSTSAGPSADSSKDNNKSTDIMEIVDSVLDDAKLGDNNKPKKNPAEEMKSLEDFRKETEEMLKNASLLLDEFKAGRKEQPPEEKKEESSPKVTVGACPVCLESLSTVPAAVTVCGHIFCKECITKTAQTLKKCPTCRKPINLKKFHPIYF